MQRFMDLAKRFLEWVGRWSTVLIAIAALVTAIATALIAAQGFMR